MISKEEFNHMNPTGKNPGKFYCTFKVHKTHSFGETPPERPIASGSGSFLENIGKFVNFYIKDPGSSHPTFLKDTPDFLRCIEEINDTFLLPDNTILVSMDVSALFTNIPTSEGLKCTREALEEENTKDIPKELVLRLLELILNNNIFEFKNQLYRQLIGAAMGSSPIPPYANIFMARQIDNKIKDIIEKMKNSETVDLRLFKRFLDDLFFIFIGNTKVIHTILEQINQIHPYIKLIMKHTSISENDPCSCPKLNEISFLDVSLSVSNGKIVTDLYEKPTDRNQYLQPSSCHPRDCFKSIPYSLALRVIRICSNPNQRDKRLRELSEKLQYREYSEHNINSAIQRALKVPRKIALQEVNKQKNTSRPVFAVTYDPRLPDIQKIVGKHWRSVSNSDQYFKEVYPKPPLTAYKRQRNIRNVLIRAKVFTRNGQRVKRSITGMKKCNKPCSICPFVLEGKNIKTKNNSFTWKIRNSVNCETSNITYMIKCDKERCDQVYVGESEKSLRERMLHHKSDILTKNITKPVSLHFNSPGHNIGNLKVTVIEKVKKCEELYRKEREHMFINKFNSFYKGLNRIP